MLATMASASRITAASAPCSHPWAFAEGRGITGDPGIAEIGHPGKAPPAPEMAPEHVDGMRWTRGQDCIRPVPANRPDSSLPGAEQPASPREMPSAAVSRTYQPGRGRGKSLLRVALGASNASSVGSQGRPGGPRRHSASRSLAGAGRSPVGGTSRARRRMEEMVGEDQELAHGPSA